MAASNDKKVLVLANPKSGPARGSGIVDRIRPALEAGGLAADFVLVSRPEEAAFAVKEKKSDYTAIVAAGGDGTINMVVAAMLNAGLNLPLGLIPSGFGNCLARGHGIPLNIEGAIQTIAQGQTKPLDLVWVNDRLMVFALSAGFDAEIVQRVSDLRNTGVNLADYLKSAWATIWHYKWAPIEVEADGRLLKNKYYQVILTNLPLYAKIFKLKSTHEWYAYLFQDRLPQGLIRYLLTIGPGMNLDRACHLAVPIRDNLTITADAPTPYSQIDGDLSQNLPLTCKIKKQAIQLLVP